MTKTSLNRRQWCWLAFILVFGLSLTLGAMVTLIQPVDAAPVSRPAGQTTAYAGSQACANCHKELHTDWMTTRHAQAFSSPIFQRDWTELSQQPSCLQCHTTGFNLVNLVNVKVTNDVGMGYGSDLVEGLQCIYDNRQTYNIRVVNISMNSSVTESYHNSAIDAAVEILWFNGIVVVVSAGNNGSGVLYPPANDPFRDHGWRGGRHGHRLPRGRCSGFLFRLRYH